MRQTDPVQVDFRPFRHAKLAGAHKDVRSQSQRPLRRWMSVEPVNGAQQAADALRVDNGGMVLHLGRDQRTLKISRDVVFGPRGRHGIAKDPT